MILFYRLATAQAELESVMSLLREKQAKLAEVEAKIAELQKTYDDSMAEKQKLERNIATTAARLKRAAKLTTALGDEQVRWSETVEVSKEGMYKDSLCLVVRKPVFSRSIKITFKPAYSVTETG